MRDGGREGKSRDGNCQGKTIKQISVVLGLNFVTVYRALRRHGLPKKR